MKISHEAKKLRHIIEKAIEDQKISKMEYENILAQAIDDAHIDPHEWALLRELQKMIADKTVTFTP
jgi:hypothetical protein